MKPRHLLAPLALIAVPALAQDLTPAETAKVDEIVTGTLQRTGVPAASVAIVRGGRIVFTKAYGKETDARAARVDSPYQIASISKQFTAAALLLLEDEGKLSLDDKVSKWLPGISGGDQISLRQLLSHTAGLQDFWPQDYSFAAMATPVTPQQIADRWAKKPLDFTPGTQWQYSNTGYVVAGMIAEKASGMPLLDYLQKKVFRPLGIKAMDQDLAVGPNYPMGYHRAALGPVRAATPPAHGWLYAAGELSMSAGDLAKWDIARMNRSLMPADDWAEQEATVKLTDGRDTGYGLGVFTATVDGHRRVSHDGEAVGFLSQNLVYPDDKTAIVVLVNADYSNAFTAIATQIAKLVLPSAPDAEAGKTAEARAVFDQLRSGKLDRARQTEDSNYYFTATTLGDYQSSLAQLGDPAEFKAARPPRLRGGFVNRNYIVTYPNGRKLSVVTYAEPSGAQRYEQFIVMPAE